MKIEYVMLVGKRTRVVYEDGKETRANRLACVDASRSVALLTLDA